MYKLFNFCLIILLFIYYYYYYYKVLNFFFFIYIEFLIFKVLIKIFNFLNIN